MTALAPSSYRRFTYSSFSDIGNSHDYREVNSKLLVAKREYQSKPSLEKSIWFVLAKIEDFDRFEAQIQRIGYLIIRGIPVFDENDLKILSKLIEQLDLFYLLTVLRLIESMLESDLYSEFAVTITRKLLKDERPEVRYTALEAISSALDTSFAANQLLVEAEEILRYEQRAYIREYLADLLSSN